MADVLAQLGAEPILNAPGIGPTLALMLNENVRIPSAGMLLPPSDIPHGMEMKHFVIQFTAGMKLVSSSHEIDVLKDNRLIATFDPLNGRVSSTKDFDSYCKDHISQMNGALISGFHLLHDPDYRDIVDVRAQDIAGWKKDNPDLYVHCEMGSFHDRAIMRHVMKRLPFDSLGLNEDELGTLYDVEEGWSGTLNAAIDLFGAIKAQRVAVHTRDYIMSIMREDGLLPPEQEIEALTVGADAAAALASSGSVIARPPYEINPEGLRARDEILSVGGSSHGRGAWILHDDLVVCISPSRLSRRPSITVGLGDTATAATFLQEVKFISKRIAALKGEIK
jgi:ADP-dependent phosphofructokinase/glucokinase